MIPLNKFFLVILIILAPTLNWGVERYTVKIIAKYPHDENSFTQGLVDTGDAIYESSGGYQKSKLKQIQLQSSTPLKEINLPSNIFAEGIAIVKNYLIVLTWHEQKALYYHLPALTYSHSTPYTGKGWGLCEDNGVIWMSNGSSELVQRDPISFKIIKKIPVTLSGKPVNNINDLVCVEGDVIANVWKEDYLIRIDKHTGLVTAIIDASNLLTVEEKSLLNEEGVLNGIAYRSEKKTFLITGKNWPHLFEVIFEKQH